MTAATVAAADALLQCHLPRADAPARLVCFPHAGGSASFFRDWGARLPGFMVHAVRYPGRAERLLEPPPTDLRSLAAEIAVGVQPLADRPLVLFGHSLGAVVALETARVLESSGIEVAHLLASGSRDGGLPPPESASDDGLDDTATMQQLLQFGGTDIELAADPSFQELVLPYVRADGKMFHAYEHRTRPRLRCPVTTIVGDADADADRRPWRKLTPAFREQVVPGDHFYLLAEPPFGLVAGVATGSATA